MKPLTFLRPARQRGFTLVEVIVAMVLTGILAGITVLFIRRPMASYIDTAGRAELADVAEIALRRMARELHGALPNSIRVMVVNGVTFVEFIPTKAGGIYLSNEDGADASHPSLSLTATGGSTFEVVGPLPVAPYAIAVNDMIAVYNLGVPGNNAYTQGNLWSVGGVGGGSNGKIVTIARLGSDSVQTAGSPGHRFQVVTAPVTFACANNVNGTGTLTRFWGYGISAAQVDPSTQGAQRALMAANVLGCQFSIQQAANQNTALIGLSIALARTSPDSGALETATLSQQIHVDNTP